MLSRDGFEALTHVYDAAIHLGRWKRALDAVAGALDAKAIALLIRRGDPAARDMTMLNSTYLNFTRTPWGIYYGLRLARLQEPDWDFLSRQPSHRATLDTEIGPDADDLDRRADYALLRKRIGVRRRLGVRLNSDRVWFDAMSIAFGDEHERIPDSAIRQTGLLLPHLTKAVEISRTFALLRSRYAAVLSALDHVMIGLAIALQDGEIIVANKEAERIFFLEDGLSRSLSNRLSCPDAALTAELESAIGKAASTAKGEGETAEHLVACARRSGGEPFLIDIAPLNDGKAEIERDMTGALITIIDPQRVPRLRMERFMALYDLTPAEAEVCALVLHGAGIEEIAEMRDTSPVTAKNQIASILAKTGCARRSELIRLVIRVLPPVE